MLPTPLCDRCRAELSDVGFYDVAGAPWNIFRRPGERVVCDACMWTDPSYIRIYGPHVAAPVSTASVQQERRDERPVRVKVRSPLRVSWWVPIVGIGLSWLLVFLAGCVGTNRLPPEPRPTDRYTKTIAGVGTFTSTWQWESTPWARIEDMGISLPVLVIIAQDGSACLVSGGDWAVAQRGKRFPCPGKWRFPRPR